MAAPYFNQTRFPLLWKGFQYLIGGTTDKKKLCLLKYEGHQNILEIGCSLGNTAAAFKQFPDCSYTGIDIDQVVIEYARKAYAEYGNFKFWSGDFVDFARKSDQKYDYILFAGIFHHIDDKLCEQMLVTAMDIVSADGVIVIIDPMLPESSDPWLLHHYINLEQGEYLRTETQMLEMLESIQGMKLTNVESHFVGATPLSIPKCARFGLYTI